MAGWWFQPYPSEKYESQLGLLYIIIPNIWKNNPNVPNHQPAIWIGTNPPEEFPWEKLPVIIWMTLFFF
jgi:hypothetical protein